MTAWPKQTLLVVAGLCALGALVEFLWFQAWPAITASAGLGGATLILPLRFQANRLAQWQQAQAQVWLGVFCIYEFIKFGMIVVLMLACLKWVSWLVLPAFVAGFSIAVMLLWFVAWRQSQSLRSRNTAQT